MEPKVFEIFNDGFKNEINKNLENITLTGKFELTRNLLNILLFVYIFLLFILGFIFFWKNKETGMFVVSILILYTFPMMMFLQAINLNNFFVVTDYCDSVNQAIYQDKLPIHYQGIGWMYSCHSSDIISKGYSYHYQLYQISQSLEAKIKTKPENEVELIDINSEIINTKKKNLDPLLTCNAVKNVLVNTEKDFCKEASQYAYYIFVNYFWSMFAIIFVFLGFNRLVCVIKRRLFDLNQKLMAEESSY